MKEVSRFSALAVAISLAMLLGSSIASNVYAEDDRDRSHIIEESARNGAFSFMQKPLEKHEVLLTSTRALEITAHIKDQYL